MDDFLDLLESVAFRIERDGKVTPLTPGAAACLGDRAQTPTLLMDLFGCPDHASLRGCAERGESRAVVIPGSAVGSTSRIKWEFVAERGEQTGVIAFGVNWVSAGALIEKLTKETLIFKELVMNVAPRFIVDAMLERKAVQPKAYRESSILFINAVGFAQMLQQLDPVSMLRKLDHYFSMFDRITTQFGVEKIKTVGDAYMAASGIPRRKPSHAVDATLAGLGLLRGTTENPSADSVASQKRSGEPARKWEFRVGVHSGPCISGVLGSSRYMYDLWGDTVNIAAELANFGAPGRVNVSGITHSLIAGYFDCTAGDAITVAGMQVPVYVVDRLKPAFSEDEHGITPNAAFRELIQQEHGAVTASDSLAAMPPYLEELLAKIRPDGSR